MEKLIKVAINDFRLVFRDNSLKFFFIFPLLNLFVVHYGVPFAVENFPLLEDFKMVIVMSITTQGSLIFGFIYSMVLIDEKDTNVAKVYGILPISKFWFVIFRLITPFLYSVLASILILLVEPFYNIPLVENILYSVQTGLVAPMMVLFVAIMAKNKIEGMSWQKLFNIPVTMPLLAFLIPVYLSYLFAIFPTYWAYQGFNKIILGENFLIFLFVSFVYSILVIALFARRFTKLHFQ